jgi:hypothetical protein
MSPWQAEHLFSASPHLALYVQRLWIDIPPSQAQRPGNHSSLPRDCYPPLQTVLPTFTRIRRLLLNGPANRWWADLPDELKKAMQTVILLPSLKVLQFAGLRIPAALITSVATYVPVLSLFGVVIKDSSLPSDLIASTIPPTSSLRTLTLGVISESMVPFLAQPGALSTVRELSIRYPEDWMDIYKILQGTAATLTHLHCNFTRASPVWHASKSQLIILILTPMIRLRFSCK